MAEDLQTKGEEQRPSSPGTLSKATRILEFLAINGTDWSIRELAERLEIPRATLHRVCQTLVAEEFLEYDPKLERYAWGHRLTRIARAVHQSVDHEHVVHETLTRLVAVTGETALVTRYDGRGPYVTITDQVVGDNPVRYQSIMGVPVPIHAGATGRAVLAFLSDATIAEIIAQGLEQVTDATITDTAEVWAQIAATRKTGYAVSHGERAQGAVAHCCPVFGRGGKPLGSLCVTVPEYRHTPEFEDMVTKELLRRARELSYALRMPAHMDYPVLPE